MDGWIEGRDFRWGVKLARWGIRKDEESGGRGFNVFRLHIRSSTCSKVGCDNTRQLGRR